MSDEKTPKANPPARRTVKHHVKQHVKPNEPTAKQDLPVMPPVKHHAKPGEGTSEEKLPPKPTAKPHVKLGEETEKDLPVRPPVKHHLKPGEEISEEKLPPKPTAKHHVKPDEETEKDLSARPTVKHHAKPGEETSEEKLPPKPVAKHHAKPGEEPEKDLSARPPVRHHAKPGEEPSEENLPLKPTVKHHVKRQEGPSGSSIWRRFAYNLVVGLVVYVVAIYLGKTGTGEELADNGFDILTKLESAWFSDRNVPISDAPVYFILMTHDDQQLWNDHGMTSRGKLARLVEAAYEKEADAIVLDVLFQEHADGDDVLRKAFSNLTSHRRSRALTKVILPVEIDHDGSIKGSIFDDLIARYPGIFLKGLAYIEATGSKALVRYWTPYRIGKTADGKEEGVWGIPALAAAITAEKDRSLPMEQKAYVFSQRIRYRLMPETRSTLRITMPAVELESGQKNPLPSLKGKVVLIGNTSPDMADIHRTPVGPLPGIYIIGNAINTVLYGLRAPILPRTVSFLFQFSAVLIAAVAFTLYPSARAYMITVAIYLVTLFPLGCLMYLRQGDLYHFMLPVIGMRLRMKLSKYQPGFQKLKAKYIRLPRWRRKRK